MPATYWTFVIGGLALAGFPLTAGFFSKDEILAKTFEANIWLYAIGVFTALLTAFYTFRAIFMTFHGKPKDADVYAHVHENKPVMTIPLIILAVLSVLGGLMGLPSGLGLYNWLDRWLEPVFELKNTLVHSEAAHMALGMELGLMALSSTLVIVGIAAAAWIYLRNPRIAETTAQKYAGPYKVLANKYYVDEAYNALFVNPARGLGVFLAKIVDMGVIDMILVDGSAKAVGYLGRVMSRWQTGYIKNYVASIFVGAIVIGMYFFLR